MALTELRNKQSTWFQKQNHVRPAKNQVSKRYIDPSLGGGGDGPQPPASLSTGTVLLCRWNVEDVNPGGSAGLVASANDQAGNLNTGPVSMDGRTTNSATQRDVPFEMAPNGHMGFVFDKRQANWLDEAVMQWTGYVPDVRNVIAIALTPIEPFPARAAGANWYITGNGSADTRGVYWGQSDGNWRTVIASGLYLNNVVATNPTPEATLATINTLIMTNLAQTQVAVGGQVRTYQDQSGLNQPNVYVHEVLIYGNPDNSSPTVSGAADVQLIHDYFMAKWFT